MFFYFMIINKKIIAQLELFKKMCQKQSYVKKSVLTTPHET